MVVGIIRSYVTSGYSLTRALNVFFTDYISNMLFISGNFSVQKQNQLSSKTIYSYSRICKSALRLMYDVVSTTEVFSVRYMTLHPNSVFVLFVLCEISENVCDSS
jgi:hypothetical protein